MYAQGQRDHRARLYLVFRSKGFLCLASLRFREPNEAASSPFLVPRLQPCGALCPSRPSATAPQTCPPDSVPRAAAPPRPRSPPEPPRRRPASGRHQPADAAAQVTEETPAEWKREWPSLSDGRPGEECPGIHTQPSCYKYSERHGAESTRDSSTPPRRASAAPAGRREEAGRRARGGGAWAVRGLGAE